MRLENILNTLAFNLLFCVAFVANLNAVAHAQEQFVMVANEDGQETSLRQKLVTKKRVRLRSTPSTTSEGSNVLPYNIFFQLKTKSGGEEEGGFFRVGDESGKFLGWIEKENLVKWGTRYVIQPRESDKPENRFKVELNDSGGVMEFNPEVIPEDATVNAFITGSAVGPDADEDSGPFPVAMLTARVAASAAAASELDAINKMQLEVVFVMENTSFMNADYDGETLHKRTVDMAQKFVDSYAGATGNIPTKFGLVAYQDSVDDATMPEPRVLQKLTANHSEWRDAISRMVPLTIRNDVPSDGVSALFLAGGSAVGWSSNSSKHIVLLGHSVLNDSVDGGIPSFHQSLPGRLERMLEVKGGGLYDSDDTSWVGSNTSNASLSSLEQSYQAVGGLIGDRLRKTKRLHTIRVGQTIRDRLAQILEKSNAEADELITKFEKAFAEVNTKLSGISGRDIVIALGTVETDILEAVILGAMIQNLGFQDKFAPKQYQRLAGSDGYFAEMQPNTASVDKTTEELRTKIQSAVDLINKVASDSVEEGGEGNEFTAPIYRMVNSAKSNEKVIGDPVKEGVASLRNDRGRSLGEKLVMVSKNELELLKSNFDSLYQTFRQKQKRADRQDVGSILSDLQRLLASRASGQDIDANTDLRDLITDLPLRTAALQITASDIAVMNTAAFDDWLDDLDLAKSAAQRMLDTGDWLMVNEQSDIEYGFLRLSDLP
ncbi:hypothetical protein OAL35_01745 [bacterium]|nr:hypothetical protein [bacterium]